MQRLFANLSDDVVKTYALVLSASDIPYRIRTTNRKFHIDVDVRHRSAACRAVGYYLAENPAIRSGKAGPFDRPVPKTFSAVFVIAFLLAVHWAIEPGEIKRMFFQSFGADADQILAGYVYRCVTALLLHANAIHLLSNLVGLAIFGTTVAAHFGWGVGWLMVLAAGAGGNFMTALWYRQAHLSVGASTAVFAAVGLSAALMFWIFRHRKERSWRALTPIAGGMALLALLGASPHTDLAAHLFGFLSGLLLGLIYGRWFRPVEWSVQFVCAGIAGLVVGGSCVWGWILGN